MRRRIILAVVALALLLGACGTKTRTKNYHDFGTGVSVSVECDYDNWGGNLIHDTCSVFIIDDGS